MWREKLKNILIGICGLGNGHVNRQKAIIDILINYDVNIVLALTEKSYKLFDDIYPNIRKIMVSIPWIVCGDNGINFEITRQIYKKNKIDQFESFLKFSIEVTEMFDGSYPDSNGNPHVFKGVLEKGRISDNIDDIEREEAWSDLWRIFIPSGYDKTLSQLSLEERENRSIEREGESAFSKFTEWIASKNSVNK